MVLFIHPAGVLDLQGYNNTTSETVNQVTEIDDIIGTISNWIFVGVGIFMYFIGACYLFSFLTTKCKREGCCPSARRDFIRRMRTMGMETEHQYRQPTQQESQIVAAHTDIHTTDSQHSITKTLIINVQT